MLKVGLYLLSASLTFGGIGTNVFLIEKVQLYDQVSASGSVPATLVWPFEFVASSPVQSFLTFPAGNAVGVTNFTGTNRLTQYFSSQSDLNAAFPNGMYTLGGPGLGPYFLNLNADNYPVAPMVIGGTWVHGVLLVDPTQSVTIFFNTLANYGSGAGSYEELSLANPTGLDTVSIDQRIISVGGFGLTQSATAFSSYTIPAGTLTPGVFYSASLTYAQIATVLPSTPAVSLYSTNLLFYVACQSAVPIPNPVITSQPTDQTGPEGSTLTFSVGAPFSGYTTVPGGTQYTWYFNGQVLNINNAQKFTVVSSVTGVTLTIAHVATTDVGAYTVRIVNAGGRVASQPVNLIIGPASLPTITSQPQSATVNPNASVSLSVGVDPTGVGPFTYQWYQNGVPLMGATGPTITFPASSFRAGVYTVTVTNPGGTITSTGATLTVTAAPFISLQPRSVSVATGSTVVFSIAAAGTPAPTFQWSYYSVPISGATSARYVITGATAANNGPYTCTVTNSQGTLTSAPANLSVIGTANPGRLVNLSVLSNIQSSLSMGFVNGGAGTIGSENLLIRATGPALAGPPFNVPGTMVDPTLTVVKQTGSVTLATNAGWGTSIANQSQVATADAAVGAFALANPNSLDSALVIGLPPVTGGYTANVAGKTGGSGYALTEVYDATSTYTATSPRLVNLSCLATIAPGGTLTVGFVVGGITAKTVLIRVSGPTLGAAPFNLPGTMTDPQLTVLPLGLNNTLAANTGWSGDTGLASAAASVGAFAFASPASKDSATELTLPAGGYTVQASSVSGGGGLVLVEVYEVP